MADVTGEEFRTFMTILSSLKVMASAHQELADIVAEQAELNQAFQVLHCTSMGIACDSIYFFLSLGEPRAVKMWGLRLLMCL